MAIEGGCRCGAVRYRIRAESIPPVYCCHCQACQTWSGSAFSQQALVAEDQIEAVSGQFAIYENITASGARSIQRICAQCHTRLWNTKSARPGFAFVRAGTLDDAEHLIPRAHIWVKRKQPWLALPEGIPNWPENAPPADFIAALAV